MSFRNQCIGVVALGVAFLVLGSWFLGEHTPNALVLLIGSLLLAIVATQGMLVAILVMASRRERARAEDPSR
jgi:hypothetical protein